MTFPKLTQTVLGASLSLILFSGGLGAQEKLHDHVKKNGDVTTCGAIPEYFEGVTLNNLVHEATLIVRAKMLRGQHPRLTKNEMEIITDYKVQVLETLKGSPVSELTLSLMGGKIKFPEGSATCLGFYDWKRSDYPLPGQTYVFFLTQRPDIGWWPAYGALGVWRVQNDRVQAVSREKFNVTETWDKQNMARFIEGVWACEK